MVSLPASGGGRGWRGQCWPASVSPLLIWPRSPQRPGEDTKGAVGLGEGRK